MPATMRSSWLLLLAATGFVARAQLTLPSSSLLEFTAFPDDIIHFSFCLPYNVLILPANETYSPGLWTSLPAAMGGPAVCIDSDAKTVEVSLEVCGNSTSAVEIVLFIAPQPHLRIDNKSYSALANVWKLEIDGLQLQIPSLAIIAPLQTLSICWEISTYRALKRSILLGWA